MGFGRFAGSEGIVQRVYIKFESDDKPLFTKIAILCEPRGDEYSTSLKFKNSILSSEEVEIFMKF